MEKTENFLMDDKSYSLPVAGFIHLTEDIPNATSLNKFTQNEIQNEKGIVVKRIAGVVCFIVAALAFFEALKFGFTSAIDAWDTTVWGGFLTFFIFGILGGALFRRNKAVSPIPAFMKFWMSYFNVPNDILTMNITPSSNITGLFNLLGNVISNLQLFYPVNIDVETEEVVQCVAGIAEAIDKYYVDLSAKKGNESGELMYGVTCPKKTECFVSNINDTLLYVSGCINIFEFYMQGKTAKGNCIKLNIRTYFVKLGKYWAPVNPVPKFKELLEK